MDKEHVKQSIEDGLFIKEVVDVPYKNINDLLNECCFLPDYLSIDIEGMDYKVLRTLDFTRYPIQVIVAEKTIEVDENGDLMDNYMEKKGYGVYENCGSNVIYVYKK